MNIQDKQETSQKIRTFRNLEIWQLGIKIAMDVYEVTAKFPQNEILGLSLQMRRAAVSIPANIAQGFYRNSEYRQFLYISLASSAELETQLEIAQALKYVESNISNMLLEDLNHESRMIMNLIKKLNEGPKHVSGHSRGAPEVQDDKIRDNQHQRQSIWNRSSQISRKA